MTTIATTGLRAAAIIAANHASFYGIKKSWPSIPECTKGLIAAEDAVREYLADNGINWNSFYIIRARTIDTTGTKVPYMAEIDFSYD